MEAYLRRYQILSAKLGLEQNLVTGNIPPSIGKLSNLNVLSLGENKLTGEIPSSFGNIVENLILMTMENIKER